MPELTPLERWFDSLYAAERRYGGLYVDCANAARYLLETAREQRPLHGDIHHGNVLDFGERGWQVIDPKRLYGERGYDYANLFTNPDAKTAQAPGRFERQLEIMSPPAACSAAACCNGSWPGPDSRRPGSTRTAAARRPKPSWPSPAWPWQTSLERLRNELCGGSALQREALFRRRDPVSNTHPPRWRCPPPSKETKMAGASLLTLLDDIAAVLDDVSLMTKVAAKKTAGVLGDDLALNAQQVTGVNADRELPVVWAVARGSLRNKAILVPAALLISAFAPWAVIPLLMLGGAYLCFEGFEKIAHKYLPHDDEHADEAALAANVDVAALEKQKIGGAIRTDFILSAEIIAITLGTVAESSFTTQVLVLVGIALVMTIGVYGLVAGIVKLDDAGLYLSRRDSGFAQASAAPSCAPRHT